MKQAVSKQDYDQWFHNPITQRFLQMLKDSRQETMELWAREAFTGATPEATLQANVKALGGIAVLDEVIAQVEEARQPLNAEATSLNDETD